MKHTKALRSDVTPHSKGQIVRETSVEQYEIPFEQYKLLVESINMGMQLTGMGTRCSVQLCRATPKPMANL